MRSKLVSRAAAFEAQATAASFADTTMRVASDAEAAAETSASVLNVAAAAQTTATAAGAAAATASGTAAWGGITGSLGSQTDLSAALNLKAPLASPALTGTPTAPTAVNATSSTQLATTAFVHAVILDLIGAAPAALDTLKELADALGDDPAFATTMTTALGNRVRVDTAAQGLTTTQQANARTNIDVYSKAEIGDPTTDFVATFVAGLT